MQYFLVPQSSDNIYLALIAVAMSDSAQDAEIDLEFWRIADLIESQYERDTISVEELLLLPSSNNNYSRPDTPEAKEVVEDWSAEDAMLEFIREPFVQKYATWIDPAPIRMKHSSKMRKPVERSQEQRSQC